MSVYTNGFVQLGTSSGSTTVYQQTIRELDRLKEENQQLRRQLETLNAQAASRFIAPAALAGKQNQNAQSGAPVESGNRGGRSVRLVCDHH